MWDIGTVFVLDTHVPLVGGSSYIIRVKKPDNTTVDWTASVTETTKLYYATVANDLDQRGKYYFQAYVVLPSWEGLGDTAEKWIYYPWE